MPKSRKRGNRRLANTPGEWADSFDDWDEGVREMERFYEDAGLDGDYSYAPPNPAPALFSFFPAAEGAAVVAMQLAANPLPDDETTGAAPDVANFAAGVEDNFPPLHSVVAMPKKLTRKERRNLKRSAKRRAKRERDALARQAGWMGGAGDGDAVGGEGGDAESNDPPQDAGTNQREDGLASNPAAGDRPGCPSADPSAGSSFDWAKAPLAVLSSDRETTATRISDEVRAAVARPTLEAPPPSWDEFVRMMGSINARKSDLVAFGSRLADGSVYGTLARVSDLAAFSEVAVGNADGIEAAVCAEVTDFLDGPARISVDGGPVQDQFASRREAGRRALEALETGSGLVGQLRSSLGSGLTALPPLSAPSTPTTPASPSSFPLTSPSAPGLVAEADANPTSFKDVGSLLDETQAWWNGFDTLVAPRLATWSEAYSALLAATEDLSASLEAYHSTTADLQTRWEAMLAESASAVTSQARRSMQQMLGRMEAQTAAMGVRSMEVSGVLETADTIESLLVQKTTLEHQIDALEDERDETVLARNRERRRSRRERGAASTAGNGGASPGSAPVIVSVAILDAKIADLQKRIEESHTSLEQTESELMLYSSEDHPEIGLSVHVPLDQRLPAGLWRTHTSDAYAIEGEPLCVSARGGLQLFLGTHRADNRPVGLLVFERVDAFVDAATLGHQLQVPFVAKPLGVFADPDGTYYIEVDRPTATLGAWCRGETLLKDGDFETRAPHPFAIKDALTAVLQTLKSIHDAGAVAHLVALDSVLMYRAAGGQLHPFVAAVGAPEGAGLPPVDDHGTAKALVPSANMDAFGRLVLAAVTGGGRSVPASPVRLMRAVRSLDDPDLSAALVAILRKSGGVLDMETSQGSWGGSTTGAGVGPSSGGGTRAAGGSSKKKRGKRGRKEKAAQQGRVNATAATADNASSAIADGPGAGAGAGSTCEPGRSGSGGTTAGRKARTTSFVTAGEALAMAYFVRNDWADLVRSLTARADEAETVARHRDKLANEVKSLYLLQSEQTERIRELEDSYHSLESTVSCLVCMDRPRDAVLTTCGHSFCTDCLAQVSVNDPRPQCPVCRANFRSRDVLVTYDSLGE